MGPSDNPVAVWDTYAKTQNGTVLHFDILVPDHVKDPETIYQYGVKHLKSKGMPEAVLDADYCRFCHIESPSSEVTREIAAHGFYIVEMEDIPSHLADHPSRRELVLFLKAHFKQYRFKSFSGIPTDQIQQMLMEQIKNES